MAATAQGSALPTPDCRSPDIAPAGAPQRWQNFAPAVSGARHAPQTAPCSGAPQLAQNFPDAAAPHDGHVLAAVGWSGDGCDWGDVEGVVIGREI